MLYLYGNIPCDLQPTLAFTQRLTLFTSFLRPPQAWRSEIPDPVGKEGARRPCLPPGSPCDSFRIFLSRSITFSPTFRPHKSFGCNTYGSPRKCCKQKAYVLTKPFRCNTYKNQGEGAIPNYDLSSAQDWLSPSLRRSVLLDALSSWDYSSTVLHELLCLLTSYTPLPELPCSYCPWFLAFSCRLLRLYARTAEAKELFSVVTKRKSQ